MADPILLETTGKRTLARLRQILETHHAGKEASVFLYGSRATGKEHKASDINFVT